MRLKKLIYLLLCAVLTIGVYNATEATAEAKPTAGTAQTSASKSKKSKKSRKSKKKSSRKKSKSKSGKRKKKGKSSKKSRNKRKRNRNVARSTYKAPEKEQPQNDSLTLTVNRRLIESIPTHLNPGGLRVNSVKPNKNTRVAAIGLNENFTYMPITRNFIDSLSRLIKRFMPDSLADYRIALNVGKRSLGYYIHNVDKLPEKYRKNPGFVEEVHPDVVATKGMDNDILALWHSHGRYFKNGSWQWQRPVLYETIEDIYTMSYILPYVVPMLENAGAYVMLPRERDTNRNEVIVDNDTNDEGQIFSQPYYREKSGVQKWDTGEGEGFIYDLPDFRDTENPFENGTYRQVATQNGGTPSVAAWYADIPEDGEYAVYVSYKTLPNSSADARYTVNYSGGSKEFKVNQQMGGGTWIYLGTFPLEAGFSDTDPIVTLTNLTDGTAGTVVTADAVKIGGGMGNIARSPRRADIYYDPSTPETAQTDTENVEEEEEEDTEAEDNETITESADDIADTAEATAGQSKETPAQTDNTKKGPAPTFRTSGMPRFLEGARYWLHWAGFPEYVYSPYHGSNDYKDDYTGRGHWVNYLAGGSRVLPDRDGLNIPVDAVLALHSDAGKRADDSFVGTLGIYFTQNGDSYKDGTPRINSRMLTDMVMQQITKDIRRTQEPAWTRRSMWDKSYVEARIPEVPTTLIELMSHQNYADMTYGLDPDFRFTVGRAIYKGLARFLAERKGRELVIQPLPVHNFMIKRTKKNYYQLSWTPTDDPLEPTAKPDRYIIMERSGADLGFHKIGQTKSTHFDIKVTDNDIHSFYVIAANAGGKAFPSETLALREAADHDKPVLVVNGFTRISAPGHHADAAEAGFDSKTDFGVPYVKDISFAGHQTEFRRNAGDNTGRSGQSFVTQIIAGNTFDYPAVHGDALEAAADLGFVSVSVGSVMDGEVKLSDYDIVDLILGKQKSTLTGRGHKGVRFRAFPEKLQKELHKYVDRGGDLIVSGQYVASDLYDSRSSMADRKFATEVLGVAEPTNDERQSGSVRDKSGKKMNYSSTLNKDIYIVEKPDVLIPSEDVRTEEILTFSETGTRAGHVADHGKGHVVVLTVPIEALTGEDDRTSLMKKILNNLK